MGHLYDNMTHKNKDVVEVLNRIQDKHMNLHKLGEEIISQIKSSDYDVINKYNTTEQISKDLINEFNMIINIAKKLDDSGRNVYEE